MKFLLILLLVMVGIWLWRSSRETPRSRKPAPPANTGPQEMVRCAHCAVHLPASDAVPGKKGLYCSSEHLQRAEP
jgi:uncharacterized protein